MFDFLNKPENNNNGVYTPEAIGFVLEALNALLNGNDVDWDEGLINGLSGEELCVFKKLNNLSLYKSTVKKFETSKSYNLIIDYDVCSNTDLACTDQTKISKGIIKIKVETRVNSRPLEFAAILLHEGIHAELFKYVDEHFKGKDPKRRENLLYWYFEVKKTVDPKYQDARWQHQHMADRYVRPIAEAIRKLDNNKYPLEYYMGFGWDGLRKYGYDGYFDNGIYVNLDKNTSTQYYKNQKIVNENTNFKSDDCN